MKPFIYLASPYTKGDPCINTNFQMRMFARFVQDDGICKIRHGLVRRAEEGDKTYVLDFDQQGPTEFDLTFPQHGINVIVDKKSEFFIGGTVLDFNDGLLDRGFVFKNPQASGSCGCGTSFSA